MNDRPLTWFLVTALGLWGLWLWRTQRLGGRNADGTLKGSEKGSDSGGGGTLGPLDQPPKGAGLAGPGPTAYGLDSFGGMLR